jgi:hypothetical protein
MADAAYGSESQQQLVRPRYAPAHACWWYQTATGTAPEIWCYTDRISYIAGDTLRFHVSTTAETYDLHIYRDGAERETVYRASGLPECSHAAPANSSEIGCGWPVALQLTCDPDWRSGGYIAVLSGHAAGCPVRYEHWFAVRPPVNQPGDLLLVATTATWVAYNAWGGSNSYEGIWGADGNRLCPVLSLQRPWGHGVAWLPEGAPRLVTEGAIPIGWVPRYPALEWAMANSYPKYYATHGWASYEALFVRWAERTGYRVNVVTQHDLHDDPHVLDNAPCVVVVGHDEYWSWEMRDRLDAYMDSGGHVARFAGNFWWQVRMDEGGTRQRCHKHFARAEDPVMLNEEQQTRLSGAWDDPHTGRPSMKTMGVSGPRGVYLKFGGFNPRGSGGFTVYRPNHWAFAGADLYYGDILGASANIAAFEVDGLDYIIRNGLPEAVGTDGVDPADINILALVPACLIEENHGNEGTSLFVGRFDCEYVAEIVFGSTDPATVDRASRGCGAILVYRRGLGSIFNAATTEWVNGLRLREEFVERITRNVLNEYLSGHARNC